MNKWVFISLLLHGGVMLSLIKEPTKTSPPVIVEIKPISRTPKKVSGPSKSIAPSFNTEKEAERGKGEAKEENPLQRKENIYKNYFDRIRQEIEPPWRKKVASYFKKTRPSKTLTSIIVVIIDTSGKVVKIILAESCGISELDRYAIEAFQGKMFPNPPKGLIDEDGYGRIPWSFVIYRG